MFIPELATKGIRVNSVKYACHNLTSMLLCINNNFQKFHFILFKLNSPGAVETPIRIRAGLSEAEELDVSTNRQNDFKSKLTTLTRRYFKSLYFSILSCSYVRSIAIAFRGSSRTATFKVQWR